MTRSIQSRTALARAMKRSRQTIHEWLHRDDWPFRRKPPWSAETVGLIVDWMKCLQDRNGDSSEPPLSDADLAELERYAQSIGLDDYSLRRVY